MMAAGGHAAAEHRIQIPAAPASQSGPADHKAVAAAPEKWLNYFLRLLAVIESVGNAFGTLAFTWATVVLLGGYPTVLKHDFGIATAIIFLEATRMFTRNNRLDYQLFFRTRGAFRPLGWNGLMFLCAGVLGLRLRINSRLRRQMSLWSPMVAILLLASCICRSSVLAIWIVYGVLHVVVLLVTISRLQFPIIINRVHGALGRKYVFWRPFILYSCMLAAIVLPMFMIDKLYRYAIIVHDISALVIVSFGNLQIPAALVRVVLATLGFDQEDYDGHGDTTNLPQSLTIFYGMVLGQGLLYIIAAILEVFSFIPRIHLVRRGGFTGRWGAESVDMYYAYAYDKYMEGGLFAPKRISLSNFAMDSLNSDLSKNQLYGVQMMHIFLQSGLTRARLLEKLTTSTQTMARLISMLDWSSRHHRATIRLYAAKVTAELAKNLRVETVPGTLQLVSTLLDADGKPKRGHPLLDADDDQDHFVDIADRQDKRHDIAGNQGQRREPIGDTNNLLETPTRSTHINDQRYIPRIWQRILEYWSIPKEQPLTDDDLLPALGMSIIYSLAGCDQNNCVEIDRVTDLIPNIIGFTSFRSAMVNSKAQQKVLLKSSLKVLQRLTSIEGEIGITLRYKISKHPFLLRNLAEILRDSSSNKQELRKLVVGILRNLAIDRHTRQEMGQMQMLITTLIKAFLDFKGLFSSDVDCLLPKVAGQALVMLSSENSHNCFVMLKEPDFIHKLKNMILIHGDKYIYVAASLLRNMCLYAQLELTESDQKELSHTLREVLERIMDTEGAELEILIGLSSQICKLIPEEFSQELEHGQIKWRFIKRLVDTLNANMNPSSHCPGIRRVVLEQSIHMMEYNSRYANCFNEYQMMDALSFVELTPSRAENYMVFLGDAGFMECNTPLSALVDKAKELMGRQWLQGINSAN
uniref:BLE2 protein n=1 Tax=Oryza barthii TaxID=65489 RepID=A0A0D3GUD2_9ORYZ